MTFDLYLALCVSVSVCPCHDCGGAVTSSLSDALPAVKTENQ